MEHVTVADTRGLRDNKGTYTVILNESGGIVDDAIVNRISDTRFYVVANAGCADKDLAHLKVRPVCTYCMYVCVLCVHFSFL